MTNPNIYVIMKVGFEYNDEINEQVGDYGDSFGQPILHFFSLDKAKEEYWKRELKGFQGIELRLYMYSLTDYINFGYTVDDFKELFNKFGWEFYDDFYDLEIPKDISLEQLKELKQILNLSFYEIITVESGE